jgi:hypothetical protein
MALGDDAVRELGGPFLHVLTETEGEIPITHNQIFGIIMGLGNDAVLELGGTFVTTFGDILNNWDPNTNSYVIRSNLASLMRYLLCRLQSELDSTSTEAAFSDLTSENEGRASTARTLVRQHAAAPNLAGVGSNGDTALQGIEEDFAGGLHISDDSPQYEAGSGSERMIALFSRWQLRCLEQRKGSSHCCNFLQHARDDWSPG